MRAIPLLSVAATLLLGTTACFDEDGIVKGDLGDWVMSEHPCVGHRTDAMWFDDASTGAVSCGSTTEGYGLYETEDGGQTWAATASTDDYLATMRINSISRAADGVLYLGGTGDGGGRVMGLDSQGTLSAFYTVPSSGAQSWQTFQVGTFRMDSTGRAVSESLTGSDVMLWDSGAAPASGSGWWNSADIEGSGAQILDMELYGDRLYAVGSTISQPPYFFYEPAEGMGGGFELDAIKLSGEGVSDFIGEVWDLAIDSSGDMLLAGVNEGSNSGVLWHSEGDPTQAAGWTMYDITPIVPDSSSSTTRLYGACRDGELMVAVGDYSQRDEALVVLSTDGGETWDLTSPPGAGPDAVGPLSRCQILGGKIYITGADGFFGILEI